jgi:hypothetical protein
MINLIDFIIALFRDDDLGRAFVTDPARTLSEAGLSHVSAAQLGAVAAAVPEIGLRTGDPITSLQHAVSEQLRLATVCSVTSRSTRKPTTTTPEFTTTPPSWGATM